MPNDSMRTVLVALGSGLGVALAKVVVAAFTGSTALAAEAAHSLADSGNDLFLFVAQRRSSRPPDDRHPLGYGREAYFWALIAALGVFSSGAAFSLREGIAELIHPLARLRSPWLTSCWPSLPSSIWCPSASQRARWSSRHAVTTERSSLSPGPRLTRRCELCSLRTRCRFSGTWSRLPPWPSIRSPGRPYPREWPRCSSRW